MVRHRNVTEPAKPQFGIVAVERFYLQRPEPPCTRAKNLRVIRPFAHVQEKTIRPFAERASVPIIPENCPICFEIPERMRAKRVLGDYENIFPYLYNSLQAAMILLISRGAALGLPGLEDAEGVLALAAKATNGDTLQLDFQRTPSIPHCFL
ncbi:unnamed protein product [Hydatigera taeniaeformis]|uniref:THIF-type NAD/FAD binding fold domain-containing protein n=1 Tax=Hydatigena taeniaeformis TaxID=6205 RepID=A0A0R3XBG0_HYDTA|nr:unnamed protein product [Hydatigera taeniaeformis]